MPSGHSSALFTSKVGASGTVFGSTGSAAMAPDVAHKNTKTESNSVTLRISRPLFQQGCVPGKRWQKCHQAPLTTPCGAARLRTWRSDFREHSTVIPGLAMPSASRGEGDSGGKIETGLSTWVPFPHIDACASILAGDDSGGATRPALHIRSRKTHTFAVMIIGWNEMDPGSNKRPLQGRHRGRAKSIAALNPSDGVARDIGLSGQRLLRPAQEKARRADLKR